MKFFSIFFMLITGAATALANAEQAFIQETLAPALSVDALRVQLECPQATYRQVPGEAIPTIEFCLNRKDKQKRCEFTVGALAPEVGISFDFQVVPGTIKSDAWYSIMQIHSFPDSGEAWRCPPSALVMENERLNMQNRWDATLVSKTSGNHCTEPGSTIQARTVFHSVGVMPGEWRRFSMQTRFAHDEAGEGYLRVSMDGEELANLEGPNRFNDRRPPYFKLGIYKPTNWQEGEERICLRYRNMVIEE